MQKIVCKVAKTFKIAIIVWFDENQLKYRVAKKTGVLEKPEIWEILKKTWNF